MKLKKKMIVLSIGMSLIMGGCFNLGSSTGKSNETLEEKHAKEYYVSIQDYTGEGYTLNNGEKTDKIGKAHRSEIDKAVKKFFKDKYKTEVTVHNVVGAVDGATVFVESVGEPHFYTYAIVPIDVHKEKVMLSNVWSQEGQVEFAIMGGIYGMLYEQELKKLDRYLKDITSKYPVVGMRIEAIENVRATGYTTPFYYVNVFDDPFDKLYEMYLKKGDIRKKNFNIELNRSRVNPRNVTISIHLYMKEKGVVPDKDIFDKIVADLENMEDIPPASYSVYLNDNTINKISGDGTKDNTIERGDPNYIVKPNKER
ncbi:DUF1672 family protein [Heyndrickxia sporothermodurans]